jgi:hypothetical protein
VSEPVVRVHWVRSPEGIWYVLDGCGESPIMSAYLQSFVTDLLTDIFRCLGRTLVWEDDVDDESGRLA